MDNRITIARGHAASWTLTFLDAQAVPVAFTGAEPLRCTLWAGGDQTPVGFPAVAWDDAAGGTATLTLEGADTAALAAGAYRLDVDRTDTQQDLFDGVLDLTESHGTAPPLKTYCSYRDLLTFWPSLADFEHPEQETQFLRQRHQARLWLEYLIQRHYRVTGDWGLAALAFGNPTPFLPFATDGPNPFVKQWLDADLLMLGDGKASEITAKKSLGEVLSTAAGPSERETWYAKRGRELLEEAEELVKGYVACLDLNLDGVAEVTIPCMVSSSRW